MRKKCTFEKITDVMIVGSLVGMAFCIGYKCGVKAQQKRGVSL